jgi:hypothetical protein
MPATAPTSIRPQPAAGAAGSIGETALRRASTRARKAGLLGEAARHFGALTRPTRQDISVFRELFYQLVDGSTKSERRVMAASLARNPYTPRTILLYLALDDYDVAAPVLLFSDSLTEQDIRNLAIRVSRQSLEILCRRATLTPIAAEALLDAGGSRSHELLSRNVAIQSDPAIRELLDLRRRENIVSAAASLKRAPAQARLNAKTPAVVAAREEMREQAAGDAILASAQLASTEQALAEPAPAISEPAAGDLSDPRNLLIAIAARGGNLGRAAPQAVRSPGSAAADPRLFEPDIVGLARAKDRAGIAARIESHCGLPARHSRAVLEQGGAGEMIVLLKGVGMSDLGTIQVLLQLDVGVARNLATYNQAKAILTSVDLSTCRSFVEGLGATREAIRPAIAAKRTDEPVDRAALYAHAAKRRQEILARAGIGPAPAPVTDPVKAVYLKSA